MVAGVTSDAENSPVRLEVRATGDAVHEVREERACSLPSTRWSMLHLGEGEREARSSAPSHGTTRRAAPALSHAIPVRGTLHTAWCLAPTDSVTGNSSWGVWGGVELPPKTWVVKGLAGISGQTLT